MACLIAILVSVRARAAEPGTSHELAQSRTKLVSDVRYKLAFTLNPHAASTQGSEVLTFQLAGPMADLPLDFRDGTLEAATVNSRKIPLTLENGHLTLPAAALQVGVNRFELGFTANVAAAGKAITRYTDRDDGSEYVYTLFVPMDADMAFPCFDQPDLKGRFTLSVTAPSGWTVLGNTHGQHDSASGATSVWSFPETRPISTYLFAFAAGPFARIAGSAADEPDLYVRVSQRKRAQSEAPEVQQMAASGIGYLSDYFAQPFPFPKYDLVLIPGFPFGGMEHAGETFLNEDGVLFRSAPTASDYFRRDILVLHETTHQWFGDLVTMRWFDDLWLKEGFAQYMAYKAMTQLKPSTNPWKHFYEDIKPLAYGIDETQGTTPIYQNIPNLKDAKSAYGAIVYQKAPAVLKQLNFLLGEDVFRDGLRLYLKQHAYANATWPDLIQAFDTYTPYGLSPRAYAARAPSPLSVWAQDWITRRGMPQVDAEWTCSAGKLSSLTLRQHSVLAGNDTWPIASQVLLGYTGRPAADQVIRVDWSTASTPVMAALGKPCPDFLFANAGDFAYGRFLLDQRSVPVVSASLSQASAAAADPLLHTMLWGALWDNVHVAQSPARAYAELALKTLPTELDESLNRVQGGRLAVSLHAYLSPRSRNALSSHAEQIIADRMLHAPTLGLRIVNFRTFTSIATTSAALAQVKAILSGSLTIPGLTLQPLDHWNLIGRLIAQNDPDAAAMFAAEQQKDHSGEAQKYAYAQAAATPDAAIKTRYFDQYLRSTNIQEDWISQSLGPFNSWNQTALTEPYLTQALDALPSIKRDRKIFFLGAWLGAFIGGQTSLEAQATVHAWLARPGIDPDLRLKVLEVSDGLDRTVTIRRNFPE